MVSNEMRTREIVRTYTRNRRAGLSPSQNPPRIPAHSKAVPVAESALKEKTASSGVGFATAGGTRRTAPCRRGMWTPGAKTLLKKSLTLGSPQTKTNTERRIHGNHAFHAGPAGAAGVFAERFSVVRAAGCSSA